MVNNRLQLSKDLISSIFTETGDTCEWLKKTRKVSEKRFLNDGIPLSIDEEWRLSSPDHFNKVSQVSDEKHYNEVSSPFKKMEKVSLVFVDGVFSKNNSNCANVVGIEVTSLEEVITDDDHWSKYIFGKIEQNSQIISKRPLAALNTAFAKSGVLINVKESIKVPVELKYVCTKKNAGSLIRNVIRVSDGNAITLIEHYEGGGWSNICTELQVEKSAVVEHFRFKYLSEHSCSNIFLFAHLQEKSKLRSSSLSLGLGHSRNESHVSLDGEEAQCSISGASYLGEGETLDDDTVSVHHIKPNCKSRQVFKKVQGTSSVGVFQGKIRVEREAQKTDGYQTSRAILLDQTGKFLAKPELEIFADDVSCSHGSVSGAIDEETLFYLQSRGIDETLAKNMLILAFLSEVFDEIADNKIKSLVLTFIEKHLKL